MGDNHDKLCDCGDRDAIAIDIDDYLGDLGRTGDRWIDDG
jgi:hypothetical protein